jgi:Gpi18-like mannosyltransferase
VLQVLPAWIIARVCVAVALTVAHNIQTTVRPGNAQAELRVHQGLLAWDGGWYQSIAVHGYVASGLQSVRFFPAYPMAARALSSIPGVGVAPALVVIANVSALAAMAALVVLVGHDLGDPALGRRAGWLLGLAPSAYTLVLGYADATLLLCSIVTLLAARTGRFWWAALAGVIAGLVRPVGILLVIPVLVEVVRARRETASGPGWASRVTAVVAPAVGAGIYLGWVDGQFHDALLPFKVQQQLGHRGSLTFPFRSMWHNATSVFHGHHVGSALHIPWVILALVLLVVAFRRLPVSYGLFAAAALAVSLTSSNLDSFERYALGAFPLVIAASTFTGGRRVEVVVLVVSSLGMVGYATLAFLGIVVP